MATTDIELQCVGNAIHLKALCQITWYETLENEETKKAAIITHFLPIKGYSGNLVAGWDRTERSF